MINLMFEANKRSNSSDAGWKAIPQIKMNRYGAWAELICFQYF